jgi:hypothetical protein
MAHTQTALFTRIDFSFKFSVDFLENDASLRREKVPACRTGMGKKVLLAPIFSFYV